MRRFLYLSALLMVQAGASAQELYVATEPASNMPRHSVGLRTTVETMSDGTRFSPEIMAGITRNLMVHGVIYTSNIYDGTSNFASGFYAKYRFLSIDTVQRHFRAAAFTRLSTARNPLRYEEVNLEGDNSGFSVGLIATQLVHRLAVSASTGYLQAGANGTQNPLPVSFGKQVSYSLSAGYLLLPKEYTNYRQVNLNLYLELLGKSALDGPEHFLEAAPAVQLIFGSRLRADISRRVQLSGTMSRATKNMFLLRLEYSFFNVF